MSNAVVDIVDTRVDLECGEVKQSRRVAESSNVSPVSIQPTTFLLVILSYKQKFLQNFTRSLFNEYREDS